MAKAYRYRRRIAASRGSRGAFQAVDMEVKAEN